MTLKDLLRKKDTIKGHSQLPSDHVPTPEVILMRSDTQTQEIISAPSYLEEEAPLVRKSEEGSSSPRSPKSPSRFRSLSTTSTASKDSKAGTTERPGNERRLSQLFHRRSPSHGSRHSSIHIPTDLPQIEDSTKPSEDQEALWEERATLLAKENLNLRRGISAEIASTLNEDSHTGPKSTPASVRHISDAQGDVRFLCYKIFWSKS